MAYIKFYEGHESKWLDLPGDDLYIRNGKVFRRKKPKRPKIYSPWIQRIVETFQATGAAWQVTPDPDRAIWKQYIPFAPYSISHYNAMLTCNVRARYPRIPALIDGPLGPRVPADPPHTPNGLAIDFLSASNQLEITWDPDYTELAYIQVFHFVLPGRRRHLPYWKYIASYYSGTAVAYITGNKLVAGHISLVTIRALNAFGEISDFAEPEEEEIEDAPEVQFSGAPTEGPAPLTVQFTDETIGTVYDYLWEFGDGIYSMEQHPAHIYTEEDKYFHVTLTAFGPAESNPQLKKLGYIHTIVPPPIFTYIYVSDTYNHRIKKHETTDLSFITEIGSLGTGDDQFSYPWGIAADDDHIYVCDSGNHRISKRLKSDLAFVLKFGSYGLGNTQFNIPNGIAVDDTYLYISDRRNYRIKKHLKADGTYVTKIGTKGAGQDQFEYPNGIAVDHTHLWVVDFKNHILQKRLKSDLSFVASIGTLGSGNNQFNKPWDVAVDDDYIYITEGGNQRIQKRLKSTLAFVAKIGEYGSGQDQFDSPTGISVDATYLYVSDEYNRRIQKRLKSDLSFVSQLGSDGSGDDNFDHPQGLAVTNDFY